MMLERDELVQILVKELGSRKFPLETEAVLQREIEEVIRRLLIPFHREYRLDADNRIDFLVQNVGLEIKIKGSPMKIFRQCERYCTFPQIQALILVTGKSMGFPAMINGKPSHIVPLARGWL